MWLRYTLNDFRIIAHYLGVLLVFAALAMCLPLIIALIFQEWEPASRYLFSVGIAAAVGSALRLLHIEPGFLNRQQAVAVTGFAWIIVSVVAAVPLSLSAHYNTYPDALFDAVSALTTTDVSIIIDMDHISRADNMWRFVMNYAGGLGLVIVAMSFGLLGRVADSSLYNSEGRTEHVLPNVVQTARFIFRFSLIIILLATVVLGITLCLEGMRPARAFLHGSWLSMSGFMTAGLAPMNTSITYYHSVVVEGILMFLMVFGCINFALQSEIWHGRSTSFLRDSEVRTAAIWWSGMLIVFISAMGGSALADNLSTLMRTGLFNFISAATTTGFITMNSNQMGVIFPSGAMLVLSLVMAVGGSAGSTTGGIKLNRLTVVAKSAAETMKGTVSPDSARIVTSYYHMGRRVLSDSEVKSAMTVFILFIVVYAIGALAGIAYGYDAVSSITESVAMASNSGITTGIAAVDMPGLLKGIYTMEMWAGRLEVVTLIALTIKIVLSIVPQGVGRRKKRS